MGFERLTSVLQGTMSNYDTDVFQAIFDAIQKETKAAPYSAKLGKDDPDFRDTGYRVIADHIRTLTFALTDGAVPNSDGRGYVLRRILRRAARYGKEKLGAQVGFLSRLVPTVVRVFSDAFPELKKNPQRVIDIILDEEQTFDKTLQKGLIVFEKLRKSLKPDEQFPGKDACMLYTTYGFPFDLTALMCEEHGITVDEEGYKVAIRDTKDISRQISGGVADGVHMDLVAEDTQHLQKQGVPPTNDDPKYIWQSTGSGKPIKATVCAMYAGDHKWLPAVKAGAKVGLVLDQTSFYAEAGGQIYDTGVIRTAKGEFTVHDCQRFGSYILHIGEVARGSISQGDKADVAVDYQRRALTAKNHTATHVLNLALRKTIGETEQKGSLVDPEKLRFDFDFKGRVELDKLAQITKLVNDQIAKDFKVYATPTDQQEALKIATLRAVFGEKYPQIVRVVSVGVPVEDLLKAPKDQKWFDYSVEFCGGTHLASSKEIEHFVIVSEEGVAKGVRRIVAYTANAAREAVKRAQTLIQDIKTAMGLDGEALTTAFHTLQKRAETEQVPVTMKEDIAKALQALSDKDLAGKKEAQKGASKQAETTAVALAQAAKDSKQQYVTGVVEIGSQGKALTAASNILERELPNLPILLLGIERADGGKVTVSGVVPKALESKVSAAEWVNACLARFEGKGGGKPARAQGNIQQVNKAQIKELLDIANNYIKSKLP
jgi:alanyl-tRNA synthetase